jgi:hypothetical protein
MTMSDINEVKYEANSSAMRSAAAKVFKNIYAKVKAQSNADYSKIFVAVKQGANAPGKLPLDPAAMEIVPWVEDVTTEIEGDGTAFLFTDSDIMDVAYDVAEQLLDALRKDGKIPPKGMREGKQFSTFRKQLDEQSYQTEKVNDVGLQHSLNIARKTVKMNDVMINVMGGMNKKQAWELLSKHGTPKEKAAANAWLKGQKESENFPDGRTGTVIGRYATRNEAVAAAKRNAGVKEGTEVAEASEAFPSDSVEVEEAMAKVALNPNKKIGYQVTDVGPGGKRTVSKSENFPEEEPIVQVREAGHQTLYRYKGKYYIVSYSSLANETMIFAGDASGKPTSYAGLWSDRGGVHPDAAIKEFLSYKFKKDLQVTVGR